MITSFQIKEERMKKQMKKLNAKSNADDVGVAAHSDPQTKRHYLNSPNNNNNSNANTSRSNNKRSIKWKFI